MNSDKQDGPAADYTAFDTPAVTRSLFHPRSEILGGGDLVVGRDHYVPVAPDVKIGAAFHVVSRSAPNILFFHGNGEIVSDYHDLGEVYNQQGINLLAVDYRGYGRSDGSPTVSAMMEDCHAVYAYVRQWLADNRHDGPFVVMGRSLGSASALALASAYPEAVDGLIIESGFAYAVPLLQLLGVDTDALGLEEEGGFDQITKIAAFTGPTLIIHAERDHIIPFSDGKALYEAAGAADKRLLPIPGADHNNILYVAFSEYFSAIQAFASRLADNG